MRNTITLDLSETACDKPGVQLPRGMIEHKVPTTRRVDGKHQKYTRRWRPLFPEFGEARDASAALDRLLSPPGVIICFDGRAWAVTYLRAMRQLHFVAIHGCTVLGFPIIDRWRYPNDPELLDLKTFPELVLFGQPQQRLLKLYAWRSVSARNLFTIAKGNRVENVLVVTDGWGFPVAGFLDHNKN
jgi:hypothetical protein